MTTDEFDADFETHLLEAISSDRTPSDVCESLQDDHHSRALSDTSLVQSIVSLNRVVFANLCHICRLDFLKQPRSSWLIFAERKSQVHQAQKRLPRVLLAVYIACCVYLLVHTCFQYIYDANRAKLAKIRIVQSEIGHRINLTHCQLEFQQRAAGARAELKRLGGPFVEWSFVVQSVVLVFTLSGLYLCVLLPRRQLRTGSGHVATLFLLNRDQENRVRAELVLRQLRELAMRSRWVGVVDLDQMGRTLAAAISIEPGPSQPPLEHSDECLVRLYQRHQTRHRLLVCHLKAMALEGRLNPLNRSPACRDRLTLIWFFGWLATALGIAAIVYLGTGSLSEHFRSQGALVEFTNWQDYFYAFSFWLFIQVHATYTVCVASVLLAIWLDQVAAASRLRKLIVHTVGRNHARVNQLLAGPCPIRLSVASLNKWRANTLRLAETAARRTHDKLTTARIRRELERDLLAIVIHCRALTHTMKLAHNPLSSISIAAVWFSGLVLVVSRLHAPYFHQELRVIISAIGVACAICSLLFLFLLSLLHQRNVATFRELWPLAAQLSYFETMPQVNKLLELRSSVALSSLRRELADSRQRIDGLACRVFSLPITSQHLIRVAIWAHLLVYSIVYSGSSHIGGGFDGFSSDPFNLFEFMLEQRPGVCSNSSCCPSA